MTVNQGNDVGQEYITISQSGDGEYTFADNASIYWDTEDYKTTAADDGAGTSYTTSKPFKTKYTFSQNVENLSIVSSNDYKAVQLGEEFKITATQTGDVKNSIRVVVSAEAVLPGVGFKLPASANELIIMQIVTEDSQTTYLKLTADNVFKAWDGTSDPAFTLNKKAEGQVYNYAVVKVFCACPSTPGFVLVEREHSTDPYTGAPSGTPVSGGKLKFTVTETGVNAPATPTAMSLTVADMDLTVGQSAISKVSFTVASGVPDDRVTFTYSAEGKVTATVEGNVITVHADAVTDSTVTITVKSVSNPAVSATITVDVTAS